jgi:hypothetical protein
VAKHRGVAEVLPQLKSSAAPAARTNHTVLSDESNGRRGSEIDPVVKVGQMLRVERCDDHPAEPAFSVEEAPCELDRPLSACTPDDRLADVKTRKLSGVDSRVNNHPGDFPALLAGGANQRPPGRLLDGSLDAWCDQGAGGIIGDGQRPGRIAGSGPHFPPRGTVSRGQGSQRPHSIISLDGVDLTRLQYVPRRIRKVRWAHLSMTAPPKQLFIGALILIGLGIVIALF